MSKLIPQDIESFLVDLSTFNADIPGAFEEYARTAAALLYDKYCILQDASIQIMPRSSDRSPASSEPIEK
jgi:hypothetical protein